MELLFNLRNIIFWSSINIGSNRPEILQKGGLGTNLLGNSVLGEVQINIYKN